jgi:hypothetical protein
MDTLIFESKSSMDKMTKIKTAFVSTLFFGVIIFILIVQKGDRHLPLIISGSMFVLYIIAMTYGVLNTPVSYKITNDFLVINKRRHPVNIPISDVNEIREFGSDDKKGLIRTFGAEGIIGNLGKYSSRQHKALRLFTSRDTNWVLIKTNSGKKYVISPDNLELIEKVIAQKRIN